MAAAMTRADQRVPSRRAASRKVPASTGSSSRLTRTAVPVGRAGECPVKLTGSGAPESFARQNSRSRECSSDCR